MDKRFYYFFSIFFFVFFVSNNVFGYVPVILEEHSFEDGVLQVNLSYPSFNSSFYILNNYSNFSSFNVRVFDGFKNNNTQSLLLVSPDGLSFVVNPFNSFVFEKVGVWQLNYFNGSNIGFFNVFNTSDTFVLKPFSNDFVFFPNNYSFSDFSVGGFKSFNFSVDDFGFFPPDTYNYDFKLFYNDELYFKVSDDVVVKKNYNFSVFPKSLNLSFGVDEPFNLSFYFKNEGNFKPFNVSYELFNLSFLDEDKGSFLLFDNYNKIFFKNSSFRKVGVFNGFIHFFNDKKDFFVPINVSFYDDVKPKINGFSVASNFTFVPNKIFFDVKDDFKVKNLSVYDEDGNLLFKNESVDCNSCIVSFNTRFLRENYFFKVCAFDFFNNSFCKTFEFKPELYNAYTFNNTVLKFKTSKFGVFKDFYIFSIVEDDVPVNFTLLNVDFNILNGNGVNVSKEDFFKYFDISVLDGNGAVRRITSFNKTVSLFNSGDVYLRIKGKDESDFFGFFKVEVPDYFNNSVEVFQFEGRFRDYNVDKSVFTNIFGNIPFNCKVNDTGVYETSKIVCNAVYPLDFNFQDNVVPISKSQFDSMKKDFESKVLEEKHKFKVLLWVFVFFVLFYFFTVFTLLFFIFKPFLRFRIY